MASSQHKVQKTLGTELGNAFAKLFMPQAPLAPKQMREVVVLMRRPQDTVMIGSARHESVTPPANWYSDQPSRYWNDSHGPRGRKRLRPKGTVPLKRMMVE